MKERPILFSAPMVRALLAGQKTQTRRVVTPQPYLAISNGPLEFTNSPGTWAWGQDGEDSRRCPYGVPGDALLVKESWCVHRRYDHLPPSKLPSAAWRTLHWMADGPKPATHGRTRPGRFLPNARVRTRLEVTGVRVERVRDISAADILAEGAVERAHNCEAFAMVGSNPKCPVSAFDGVCYPDLSSLWRVGWSKINGADSWDRNDWVWVVEFKVLTPGGER